MHYFFQLSNFLGPQEAAEVREDEEAMDDAEHQGEASLVLQPRPRHGVVARATAWLLDSVFGPAAPFINRLDGLQTRVSGVSIWEIREAGWLQPLMGSLGLKIRSTSNSLFHTLTFGSFSAVSTLKNRYTLFGIRPRGQVIHVYFC